jgi:hypothetical protein
MKMAAGIMMKRLFRPDSLNWCTARSPQLLNGFELVSNLMHPDKRYKYLPPSDTLYRSTPSHKQPHLSGAGSLNSPFLLD